MSGRHYMSVIAVVSRYGFALLILLGFPGNGRAASTAWPEATLHIEQMSPQASGAFESGRGHAVHLPFLNKKTYHIDALSLPALGEQRRKPVHECTDAVCAGNTSAVGNHTLGLYDARQHLARSAQGGTSERFAELLDKSAYVSAVDVGIIMVMRQLPTSFTKWTSDRFTEKTPLLQWQKHVTTPPVLDKDLATVNVSHAYSGSGYYTLCRNTPGFSGRETRYMLECLLYATVMSTFWEYGPEAFVEVPSIQDLLVTPLGGAVLGEMFYRLQRQIVANGGALLGSRALGRVVIVLLNPLEEVVQELRYVAGPIAEQTDLRLHLTYGNLTPSLLPTSHDPARADTTLTLQVTGRWPVKQAVRRK